MLFEAPPPKLTWQAREVVREVDHRPHLVVRLLVDRGDFPQRALVPFLHIIDGKKVIARAWFTEITDDLRGLVGYFVTDLPGEGIIEYGYDDQVLGRVRAKFNARSIKRLDRKRLSKEVIETTKEYLRKKLG
jgi:hypothetical protein